MIEQKTVGKISLVQTGPFGSQLHNKDYVTEGTPIVTVEHLGSRKMTTQNLPFVSMKDVERLNKYILKQGDIVFSRVGSVDRCSLVGDEEDGWLFSGRCLRVRTNKDTSSKYLYYYFSTAGVKQYIKNIAVGATMPSINTKLLSDVPVPLPPLHEQKAIASVLSALDDKIELNKKINKNLEEMAQAIFKSWFVDFEPFKDGEFVESELGMIPNGWNVGTINEISDEIICGKTPSTKKTEYYRDGKTPFITIPDMHNQVYITHTSRYLSDCAVQSQSKKTLPVNSICVSCIATPGLVSLTSVKSQTNQQINSIICKKNVSPYFVYLMLLTLSEIIKILGSSGSTTSNLNKRQFSKIPIIIPPIKLMDTFSMAIQPLFEMIKKNQIENEKLSQLRDTLLPKLMSGEIRVPVEVE